MNHPVAVVADPARRFAGDVEMVCEAQADCRGSVCIRRRTSASAGPLHASQMQCDTGVEPSRTVPPHQAQTSRIRPSLEL